MQKQPTHLIVHHLSLPPRGTPIRHDEDILDLEHNHSDRRVRSNLSPLILANLTVGRERERIEMRNTTTHMQLAAKKWITDRASVTYRSQLRLYLAHLDIKSHLIIRRALQIHSCLAG